MQNRKRYARHIHQGHKAAVRIFNMSIIHLSDLKYNLMDFKSIYVEEYKTQFCIRRDRSDDGKELVYLTAFVENTEGEELFFEDSMEVPSRIIARGFVNDYMPGSAVNWISKKAEEEGNVAFFPVNSFPI